MAKDLNFGEIIEALIWIVYIFLIMYVAYQVIRVLFGGTWATENIIISGMGIILGGMFIIAGFLINHGRI
jgi:hypothetical protein